MKMIPEEIKKEIKQRARLEATDVSKGNNKNWYNAWGKFYHEQGSSVRQDLRSMTGDDDVEELWRLYKRTWAKAYGVEEDIPEELISANFWEEELESVVEKTEANESDRPEASGDATWRDSVDKDEDARSDGINLSRGL
jgi:hypothetical protein